MDESQQGARGKEPTAGEPSRNFQFAWTSKPRMKEGHAKGLAKLQQDVQRKMERRKGSSAEPDKDSLRMRNTACRMCSNLGKKERDLRMEVQLAQEGARVDGKGRIRILIGKILVAKDRGEGYSKFQEKGEPLGSPFFCVVYYQSVCICYVKPDLNGELRTAHAF